MDLRQPIPPYVPRVMTAVHTRPRLRRRGVDPSEPDAPMRCGAAQDRRVQQATESHQVVNDVPRPRKEPQVFAAFV